MRISNISKTLAAAMFVVMAMAAAAGAQTQTWDCGADGANVTATLTEDGTLTVSGTGAMSAYTFSSNAPWNGYMSSITEIVIDDGVTHIGERAFRECTGLTSVTIPNSVTSIGYRAFYGCTGLTSVTIPNSVTYIGSEAFSGCTGLTSIAVSTDNANYSSDNGVLFNKDKTALIQYPAGKQGTYNIPNSVTSIGESAFSSCYGLTSVTIPNSVTSIELDAFNNCTGLTSVMIPNSVTSIGIRAFWGCTGLTSLTIPNSVTYIGLEAFRSCTGLTSLTIPNSVTSIGSEAFYGCNRLTSVTITGTGAMNYTFSRAPWNGLKNSITSVVISDGITSIGWEAFSYCTGLTSVTIPNSVTSIYSGAFSGCTGLTSIVASTDNANHSSDNGVLFNKDKTILHTYPAGRQGAYIIPNSVTSIEPSAFSGCSGLTSVTIPNSVTSIGERAFSWCTGLTSVTIPNSVTSIEWHAFQGCTGLTSVTIPNSVTEIGMYAFNNCTGLTSVTIGNSVTSIGEWAFENCTGLTSVTSLAMVPPTFGNGNAFSVWNGSEYIGSSACLHVPEVSISAYSSADVWKDFSCIRATTGALSVTFNSQNGSTVNSQYVLQGDNVAKPANPTRANYVFGGWYKEPACTSPWNFYTNVVTSDITLYAKWTIITYTVTFYDYNGTQLKQEAVGHGSAATAPTSLTRTGYTFTGWDKAFSNVMGDLTVTAVYQINTYTVTFVDYNGTQLKQQMVNYGNAATAPASPTRTGYTFTGWDKTFSNVTENLTVTAVYTINTYTVTFSAGANGALTATVDSKAVTTGASVEYGKSVVFTATPAESYKVSGWTLNGSAVANNTTNTYTLASVSAATTVSVSFTQTVSVLTPDRLIPTAKPSEEAIVIAPMVILSGAFTAGPNPVSKQSGIVNFYRQGKRVSNSELRIYDATGNVINKVKIKDNAIGTQSRRKVGSWDLTDRKGRQVSEGTYLVKGAVKTSDGKSEKVSVILGVR